MIRHFCNYSYLVLVTKVKPENFTLICFVLSQFIKNENVMWNDDYESNDQWLMVEIIPKHKGIVSMRIMITNG